jgi:hypothetical protein
MVAWEFHSTMNMRIVPRESSVSGKNWRVQASEKFMDADQQLALFKTIIKITSVSKRITHLSPVTFRFQRQREMRKRPSALPLY